ncbi:hypothetical protein NHH03_09825 [Stieleria sp. TO1_6]|uniref:hypothetical protein n=1 Tax=Stieleria tagensis TaxID=2956795 RepID=UPI00209B1E31|nr:hypothetical protein [Stieleria tagensis]MCO8122035.1 hypothetical protein [Stieleria tagensis]
MSRHHHLAIAVITCTTVFVAAAPSARAGHESPVYCAADQYREAVRKFERLVLRTRYVERYDERLADDLEDSTSRLKTAARDPRRLDRLFERFAHTQILHCRVEEVFFLRTVYPPNPQWDACWQIVNLTYQNLVQEMRCLQSVRHAGHGHAIYQEPTEIKIQVPAVLPRPLYQNDYPYQYQSQPSLPAPVAPPRPAAFDTRGEPLEVRLDRDDLPSSRLTRRTIQTHQELREAVIGALLER